MGADNDNLLRTFREQKKLGGKYLVLDTLPKILIVPFFFLNKMAEIF